MGSLFTPFSQHNPLSTFLNFLPAAAFWAFWVGSPQNPFSPRKPDLNCGAAGPVLAQLGTGLKRYPLILRPDEQLEFSTAQSVNGIIEISSTRPNKRGKIRAANPGKPVSRLSSNQ